MNDNGLAIRTPDDIERYAKMAAASGLCVVKRWEEAAFLLATGHELGLSPMQSLRGIYVVNGKPVLSADLLVAIVRRSGLCEWWRTVESTADCCTIETQRKGEPTPSSRTWTMADAKRAGITGKPIWAQYPATMLRHRCAADLAREVFADVVFGLYDPEELGAEGDRPGERVAPKPVAVEQRRPAIDAAPTPLQLPSDNGRGPSSVAPATAPEDVAPPAVDHYEMAERIIAGAASLPELAAAWRAINADHLRHLGPGEVAAITKAKDDRKAALAQPAAPKPDGDEPPPDGPRGRREAPAKATAANAEGSAANDRQPPVEGPAAWLASEPATVAHVRDIAKVEHLEASARHHGAALGPKPWGVRVYAERLAALEPPNAASAEAIVAAWMARGPKVRDAAPAPKRVAA